MKGLAFRTQPGVPLVIPERLVPAFFLVVEAARAMHRSAVTVQINVLMDGLDESAGLPTSGGCTDATTHPDQTTIGEERLTVAQAAGILGCSPQAVRKVCGGPRLPAEKFAGAWSIRAADLEKYRYGKGSSS